MKFMKLGSKPDAFQSDGKSIRYVSSELQTDVVINVGEVKFYLHKFPLLSKSNRLQKLVSKANEDSEEIDMVDFPGGPKSFEICAKFCYGMTVTLNAYNVVAARCAAEYLEMTEGVDCSNLIYKIEVFLNSSIFRSWKDSIIVLQTTKPLLSWSEDLKIVGRCIDSIASKTSVDPANITWSYTYNRKLAEPDKIIEEGMNYRDKMEKVPRDWWVEDICELDIDLYKRVMIAVKSKGRMDGTVIGEALKTYAVRWLPDSVDALVSDEHALRNNSLVETIICLLPSDKGMGCSSSFLLKLLKVSILVGADESLREELVKRISLKLHEARVSDLLIPARSPQITIYDVELVQSLVNQYVLHEKYKWDLDVVEKIEKGTDTFILGHGSLLGVGRLVDGYLAEIAHDPNLNLSSFVELSQSVPKSARPIHDGLYKAIDIYLKEHPNLTKAERKRICGLMDVKKLTVEASMDAAQNEQLPLRVVVQVLFFEQVRSAASVRALNNHPSDTSLSTTNLDEECDKTAEENSKPLGKQMSQMKVTEEFQKNTKLGKNNSKNSRSGAQLLPSRSRRIFEKLWSVGKGHVENKSSETSGSSQSPTSNVPGDSKSVSSSNEEHAKLIRMQHELEVSTKQAIFVDSSISDTIRTCIVLGNHRAAMKVKTEFKVSEKRWYWLKVFALATIRDWDALEKFSKEKRPPIGYRPFVEACVDADEKGEALKYIPKLTDPRERAESYARIGMAKEAADAASQAKDGELLGRLKMTFSQNAAASSIFDTLRDRFVS